ncbi:MAG TPA: glycosyltransferase family 25 protein [Caulobacteraceae bacterium]|nr:glycosyltransferase family 25 protein [Caulobacteraceae bacterium]
MAWEGFYINLDRAQARRDAVERQLSRLALTGKYHRFPAVDGKDLPPRAGVANPFELACYLSHFELIRERTASGAWTHVMEDDVVMSRHTAEAIELISRHPDCARYDIVFTNVMLHVSAPVMADVCRQFDENVAYGADGQVERVQITVLPLAGKDFVQTTAYVVNPGSTAKIVNLLQSVLETRPFAPLDHVYSALSRAGALAIGCTIPFFTVPEVSAASMIQDPAAPNPLYAPLRLVDTALFADRDVAAIRREIDSLKARTDGGVTSGLVADAYALVLAGGAKPAT